ncbi:K(+)-stimulated pyrophosphate-energized sodium pump [Candidatus Norongarragalina meridionalis]|nr:K(+)-stimulated pyrophosphate-energized sodium pump [Candidatus Norongarragalina meridionalis]
MFTAAVMFGLGVGAFVLLVAAYLAWSVLKLDAGNDRMKAVAAAIQEGASAYLGRQYKTLAPFVVVLLLIIGYFVGWLTAVAFLGGVLCSAAAGYVGMTVSVRANVRAAHAARSGLKDALSVAVRGGAVTGMTLVGLGLLGVCAVYGTFGDLNALIGFGFGASLISLFARVGGGIYTKAADVGADLVGKIEKGIPEDDPRNPAVIADNVGDNVGDCAGMAADLFESYAVTIIAAMLLGMALGPTYVELPLIIASVGALAGAAGVFFIRLGSSKNIMHALYKGVIAAAAIALVGFYAWFGTDMNLMLAAAIGIVVTGLIFLITEYYTSKDYAPVRSVAEAARTGAGTNLISGLAVGLESTALPVLLIVAAIAASYTLAGVYGIAIAAAAMLSLTGVIITLDAYGPITDNAGGIAEMSGLPPSVRKVTDALDAVGNTTKATTKGFAIAGAALGALALFAAFAEATQLTSVNVLNAGVVVGLFLGGLLPFLFASFLMKAVGKAAFEIVEEVRRQFREIKGLMSGKGKPDYARCVDISASAALRELMVPGFIAVASPLVVGFLFGAEALGGLLAGVIVSGFLLALFMANSGAAWDNAKKYIEDGKFGGKGSDAHKAAVVGDTVGDPFKDTAGPSLNALIKVVNTVSLVFAAAIAANALNLI